MTDWLAWMEQLHPREIELGLSRVAAVRARMGLTQPTFAIVTVAGTNGKGSTVAMLEAVAHAAGYRVGAYTSPHLLTYNERVRIGAQAVSDAQLCAAFERVEAARADVPLTYFEFGTLAAVDLFREAGVELAILEVGLGGRLDAVNAWDADVAVVTSIGIDHTDWLGPDRESIGAEKAGIFRAGRPAICGDPAPPAAIAAVAQKTGARLLQLGRDFRYERQDTGWVWQGPARQRPGLPYPAMRGEYQLRNAAAAFMALEILSGQFPVDQSHIRAGLLNAVLPGRFQTLPGQPLQVLDVAHNAEAAAAFAATLKHQFVAGRTLAVAGMLKDKPLIEVMRTMVPLVDAWHVAPLPTPRSADAAQLQAALKHAGNRAPVTAHADITGAYQVAREQTTATDRLLVFGSFYTVGAILRRLQSTVGRGHVR